MTLNSHENESNQSIFIEKDMLSFKIKLNPEGIPLINGNNNFSLQN